MFNKDKCYKDLQLFIKENGKEKIFSKNNIIFQVNENVNFVYLLEVGWAKISQEDENGQGNILSIRRQGDIFGLSEVLAKANQRQRTAYSLTKGIIYAMPAELLLKYAAENPEVWHSLSSIMASRLLETQNFVKILTSKPVPQRLAWILLEFAEYKEGIMSTNLPLTHEELSFIIGCSRQKVTTFLNSWRKSGLIDYQRGSIIILQPEKLYIE